MQPLHPRQPMAGLLPGAAIATPFAAEAGNQRLDLDPARRTKDPTDAQRRKPSMTSERNDISTSPRPSFRRRPRGRNDAGGAWSTSPPARADCRRSHGDGGGDELSIR